MFTSVQLRFSFFFFFGCFYFRKRKSADIYEKYPFLVFFGATDGNFIEKYSVTPSWQRTYLWQMTGVRIVSCRSADFKMFQMTYKYNSVSSEDFGLLKFPWKKVQHSEFGWYAHDLRYIFVLTSSCPPWRLINLQQPTCNLQKGHFCAFPWASNWMQNLKGGWKFSFPKMFDSYRDLFLIIIKLSEKLIKTLSNRNLK